MELEEPKLGRANGSADKFVYITLIFRIEEEFSGLVFFVHVFLELLLVLDDMFQDKFLLGGIFSICEILIFF